MLPRFPRLLCHVCDALPSDLIFEAASHGAKMHGRVVCWTIPSLPPHASRIAWVRGVTRAGISTTVRDSATAAAANPQTVTAHAPRRVDAVIPPQCSTPSLRFAPPTAVAAC
jgi:hypothetical protein